MSGHGGGGGNGGPVNGGSECKTIYGGATLASPKRNVLSTIKIGDILELETEPQGTTYILYATKAGQKAGTIIHASLAQIIKCIVQDGHTYVANVTTLQGGNCGLEIRMKT